jgi:hypothetical protein
MSFFDYPDMDKPEPKSKIEPLIMRSTLIF